MTTVFTPPCGAVIMAAQMETPECVAPGMSSVWRNGGFYSPGVCPSGYTTNCVRSEKRDGELIPVRPEETAAMCVPHHDVSTMTTPSTSVSMTLATVSLVQPIPTNDTRPPESSTTPATDEDPGEHNFNNSELSGIIFGICVAIMGLMMLIWCVMRYWEKNDCFSSGWSLRRNWNHRDSTRLYSPELVSTSPPMQQRPA
ncbi:hypothetical protein Cpir12675_004169 [Ceratocystis pirilliformis]|uniref:Uncharacterized protein n=1 Tax=Ceratocystis pirilliformis TaxID=259994 RepID=A0ABR3YYF6_9PEZI